MGQGAPRVVVTGLGAVTALGPDVAALDAGLRAGRCGVADLTLFDASAFRTRLAAQAPDPSPPVDEQQLRHASRPDRFGIQAAFEAVAHAGLSPADLERAVCVFGTGTGGIAFTDEYLRRITAAGPANEATIDPAGLRSHQPCGVTDLVCRLLGIGGFRTTFMTACSSSATAIGYAADQIRLRRAEVAIAGGAEGLCMLTYAGFNALRATSPEVCRPFDAERSGLNLGEGAGALVLESEERARARGAPILGFVAGFGLSADAHHMTAPHPEGDGAARAMLAALADAGLPPDAVDYVNAHGTATPHNDAAETAAIKRVFGARAGTLPISSTKSMVGHTLGAAGAIEAVTSLLALRGGYLPPTVNLRRPDPAFGIELDFIPTHARAAQAEVILSSSFAFGGNNTVLIFSRSRPPGGRA